MESEFYIRNAKVEDFDIIKKFLIGSPKTTYFGPPRKKEPDAAQFFRHYATFRLVAFENAESENMVAYGELRNYPYLWALPSQHWLDFLKMHYCLTVPISVTNTLFFNYCTISSDLNPALIKSLLREVFFRENQLRFIIIIEPPDRGMLGLYREDRLNYYLFEGVSEVFYPRVFSIESCRNTQKLHVISRSDIIPQMTYRKALPEDNDDIIEVIDVERPDLRHEFGDFYIAEELLRQGVQHNMIIVTEVKNLTAGFVWLNDNVDVLLLLENYEVDMFANLIKYDPNQKFKELEINVITFEKKPPIKLFSYDTIKEICEQEYMGKYVVQAELSSFTLSSQHNLRVLSISGIITTSDERYYLRQEFFHKIRKICDRILHTSHYSYRYEKTVNLCFNVPEVTDSEMELILPDHNSNIFALQLFGMHQNNDIRRLFRLILATFAAYPNRDYCVFSLPLGTPMTKNLKFILKYFVRMSPRPRCQIQDELYITHRSSIYGEITLHDVRLEDVTDIERLILYNIPHLYDSAISDRLHDSIITKRSSAASHSEWEHDVVNYILEDVFNNQFSNYTVKTIRCGRSDETSTNTTLVGFVVLRPFHHIHVLKHHYREPKKEFTHSFAEIVTMRLHPFYHHQVDVIFRELARVTNFFELFYFQVMRGTAVSLPNDMVLYMQPLEPKPYKTICKATEPLDPKEGESGTNGFYEKINYLTDYFAIYQHNLKPMEYCGSDKPLVIIGFSPICKAFLRTLIFSWNMPGSSISLSSNCVPQLKIVIVTEPGVMDAEYDKELVCESCAANGVPCYIDHSNWSDFVADVTVRMDVRKYIHFVSGHVKAIDREAHHVIFHNNCHIYYDQLLLLCDTCFGYPKLLTATGEFPANYIQINNRLDRIMALHKIDILRKDLKNLPEKCILVYGAHLRTFEFIQFLLSHGIEACFIKLVVPYQKSIRLSQTVFNQPVADERLELILQDMVRDMGVDISLDLLFSHWQCYKDDNNIHKVFFESSTDEVIEIECDVFVCFYETYIDPKLVDVLHKAEIKMNLRNIIVDEDFRTNDSAIFALGNFIEHKVEPNHQYKFVSHKEAAEKLIYKLGLIPIQLETPFDAKFSQPHSCQVQLPMDYTLFKAIIPKRYMINHLDNEYTHSLITYDGTFSRVRLSPAGIVEEIVVVTQQKISFQFLLSFVGRHELLLNNLRARWCHEDITCFLDYFQEPWTEFILHENFEDLLARNRKLMMPIAEEFMDLNVERNVRKKKFEQRAKEKRLHKKLEETFIKFIREHRASLRHPIALPEDFPRQK